MILPRDIAAARAYARRCLEEPVEGDIVLACLLGKSRSFLHGFPETVLAESDAQHFVQALERRRVGEPLAYILGEQEFYGLTLQVNPAVLVPRADTECLVDHVLQLRLPRTGVQVLDLGTGSGAIALAVAANRPGWDVVALDRCDKALEVARDNAGQLGIANVNFVQSDWFSKLSGQRFDLVLANPPYVDAQDPHLQVPELRHEPQGALVADKSGYAELQAIADIAPQYMTADARLIMEHGFEQGASLRDYLTRRGYGGVVTHRDLAGRERFTEGAPG